MDESQTNHPARKRSPPSRRSRKCRCGGRSRARRLQDRGRVRAGAAPMHGPSVAPRRPRNLRRTGDALVNAAPFDTFLSVGGSRCGSSPTIAASRRPPADRSRRSSPITAGPTSGPGRLDGRADGCDGRLLFDSGGAWQLLESDGAFLFTFRSSIGGPLPYKISASISPSARATCSFSPTSSSIPRRRSIPFNTRSANW